MSRVFYEHKELCDARLEIARLDEELKTQLAKQSEGEIQKPKVNTKISLDLILLFLSFFFFQSPQNDRILGQVKGKREQNMVKRH